MASQPLPASAKELLLPLTQTPGRIQKVDPPYGSTIYTIGVLKSGIREIYFLDPPENLGTCTNPGELRLNPKYDKIQAGSEFNLRYLNPDPSFGVRGATLGHNPSL